MHILVTGHKGYIGSCLIEYLNQSHHEVTGCDIGLFSGCSFSQTTQIANEITDDFRNLTVEQLKGVDCVMHLAAISNDPMGDIDSSLTEKINYKGVIDLAEKSKAAGVSRFLYSSSCSMYGKSNTPDLNEDAPLNPVSAYAVSKVKSETELIAMADDHFSPACLRNATAYGLSPMLRIDLVANNLLGSAVSYGEIRIASDGEPWRPLVHCKDIARAFIAFLDAPKEAIHAQSVNIGGNQENYQVKDVAVEVKRLVPNASLTFTGETGPDPRNYKVNFDKLNKLLPEFTLAYNLRSGLEELLKAYQRFGFGASDFEGPKFVRLRQLQQTLHLL